MGRGRGVIAVRPKWEVADVIRRYGQAFLDRRERESSLSFAQQRVLRELALCRTAALGGHVEECSGCAHRRISYNSCRNRHCPKCQGGQRSAWLEQQMAQMLPVEYHHVVFTLPAKVAEVVYQNQKLGYTLLFRAASETLKQIAADPKHLGAEIGFTAVLHTWGQTLTFHPHLHCLATGGGLTPEGRWVSTKSGFFLPVRVLARVFCGKFLAELTQAFDAGELQFFGDLARLAEPSAFAAWRAEQAGSLVRVCQTAGQRTGGRVEIPGPLCGSRGDFQPPDRLVGKGGGHVSVQGLSAGPPLADDDASGRGVSSPVSDARFAVWVSEGAIVWPVGQCLAGRETGPLPGGARSRRPAPHPHRGTHDELGGHAVSEVWPNRLDPHRVGTDSSFARPASLADPPLGHFVIMAPLVFLSRLLPPGFSPGPFSVRAATAGFPISRWVPVRLRCFPPRFRAFPVPGTGPHSLPWPPVLLLSLGKWNDCQKQSP